MQWMRGLLGVFRSGRKLVGTDLDGNKYFEVLSGRGRRARREVVSKLKHEEYEDGTIPVEWEAWIRGKRNDPPTHDELVSKIRQREVLKERVKHVEAEEIERRAKEQGGAGMLTRPVGHASSPVYGKTELQSEPIRTGNTFQPGAWTPGTNTDPGKGQDDNFEPEAWRKGLGRK
jgi:NADH dehydrogenase [ubiquinone] 1 alpha subcomplex assembly factor 2